MSARFSALQTRIRHLWGVRALANDRFVVAVFAVLAILGALRNLPAPEWTSVELRNYAWAFQRLMTGERIYSSPLPNNPLNPGAHYTPPPFTPLLGGQFVDDPILWGVINLSAMAAGVLFAAAASGVVSRPRVLPAILTAIVGTACFGPAVTVLLLGNQQGFVVLALGLAWWVERHRRAGASGVALAAGSLLKLFPGLLFVRSIARQQWRVVVAGMATAAVVVATSSVLFGFQRYINFTRNLIERAQPAFGRDFNVAPSALLDSMGVSALIVLLGVILIAWSARRDDPAVSFARAIIVSLVVWPVSWYQYASVMLIAAAATVDRRTWRWLALSLFLFSVGHPAAWLAGGVVGWYGAGKFREAPAVVPEARVERAVSGVVVSEPA
jgi:hypothetical protein